MHAARAQHEVAQSPVVSVLSPDGTQATHAPVVTSQKVLFVQSAFVAQVVLQTLPPVAQTRLPAQAAFELLHVPLPLHVVKVVSVEPEQEVPAQEVPIAG